MKEKYESITLQELLYLCYFSVMLGAKAIGLYEGQLLYNICLVIGAAFFALKIIMTKHSLIEFISIVLLLALGIVVYFNSEEKSLLIFITMMLGMKNVSIDRVFKIGAAIWTLFFVGMYVLSVTGVIPEVAYTVDRHGWPPILRHSLGYPHPNSLHITYFILCVFVIYSLKNLSRKYMTLLIIILALGNCYVFLYSLSRNGFIITSIYFLLQFYFVWKGAINKFEKLLLRLIFPFSALSMIIFPLITKGDLFERLNMIFAGRFLFTRYFLTHGRIALFGIKNISVPEESYVIDSSYVYLIFRLGLIAFVLYFVAVFLLINKLIKEDMRAELALILALSVGGINETYLFSQSYKNLIFLFLGVFLFSELAKISSVTPAGITKDIVGLNLGEKKIFSVATSKEYRRRVPVNILVFSAGLFLLVGLLISISYACMYSVNGDIYIPKEEYIKGDAQEVYLLPEEARELKKNGNIIRGYKNENVPLYRMIRRGVIIVERIRYTVSYGLWGASVASIAFLLVWSGRDKVRSIVRNKTIGADYKEIVLLVHNYYRIPGGEDIVVSNEKKLLEDNGHRVILYTRNNDEANDGNLWHKIGLAFVSILNLRTYREICSIIDKEKVDIIHVHNTVALISPAVYLAGINRGIPVIQTVHNFRLVCPNGVLYTRGHICERCIEHGLKASLLYNCYRDSKLQTFVCALSIKMQRLIQTYRAINYICLTEFNKKKLMTVKQIREDSVYIKPNFTTTEDEVVPFEKRKKQVIYAGRIEKIKGVDLMLQAWMKLGDSAPKLIICGSGEMENWCREYIDNNEMTNVEIIGHVSNSEVKRLIGESMAMIYPTQWYEGFPMAVAEAYTVGTPIIATDIGNIGNLVDEGISGIRFKSNSVISLVKAVEKFMASPIELPKEYLIKYKADANYKILKGIYESIRKKELHR